MRRTSALTALTLGLAGLLAAPGCGLAGAPSAQTFTGLKRPAWAASAPRPLTPREAVRLITAASETGAGAVVPAEAATIAASDVAIVPGSFTRPNVEEAVVSFHRPGLGRQAWQTWLLEWRDTRWYAVRRVTSGCNGTVAAAAVERHGPAALLVRDSCVRFGRSEGSVRLLVLGPRANVELFAAPEVETREANGAVASVRHSVWLSDVDGDGVPELIDMTFTERRPERHGDDYIMTLATTTRTVLRRDGWRFQAMPAGDAAPPAARPGAERVVTTLW